MSKGEEIKIKAGDEFIFNGKKYRCTGTDEGLVWAESTEILGSVSFEPVECEKIQSQQEVYNEQKLQPYH